MGFPFKSLRDWIDFLEENGNLVINKEKIDLNGEVAAVSQKIALSNGPAVLHQNVDGYPGWKIFADGLTTRQRVAWALNEGESGLVRNLANRMIEIERNKEIGRTKPRVVETGPCKEIKWIGDEVDLTKLPIPMTGEYDLPPFITAGISNIRDPETGWQNTGIRRFQLKGKNKLNNLVLPFQHEGIIFSKYIKAGKPAPVAIVVGGDPLYNLISLMPAPDQVDEMDAWGALAGGPLEVVKCETSDVLVPATAEIVIEGVMDPVERELEGPFCEFTGFYSGLRKLPVIRVTAITMRKDPIYQNMYMAVPTSEAHTMGHLMNEVELYRQIKPLVPALTDVAILSSWGMVTAVSVDKKALAGSPGLVKKLGMAIKAVKASPFVKNVIVVDDSVDVHKVEEVLWSLAVKFQAAKDMMVIPEITGTMLDPSEPWLGRGPGYTSYAVFDCTEKPAPYNEAYLRGVAQPPFEARKAVEEKWAQFGFK